jgi:hypothetical protein
MPAQVVRAKRQMKGSDKVLVVLRHAPPWRSALAAIAIASEESASAVIGTLIATADASAIARRQLGDILTARGEPNSEIDPEAGPSGNDQAYYLTEPQITALEQLAATLELSPGQTVDALVWKLLQSTYAPLAPPAPE